MIEVYLNLFVGDQSDYEINVATQEGWAVVHACKEPYHRQALGYRVRGAPKDHPEYLVARRGNRLILNIVEDEVFPSVTSSPPAQRLHLARRGH